MLCEHTCKHTRKRPHDVCVCVSVCQRKRFLCVQRKLHQNMFSFSCARGAEEALLQNFLASINGSEEVEQSPSLSPFLATRHMHLERRSILVMSSLL